MSMLILHFLFTDWFYQIQYKVSSILNYTRTLWTPFINVVWYTLYVKLKQIRFKNMILTRLLILRYLWCPNQTKKEYFYIYNDYYTNSAVHRQFYNPSKIGIKNGAVQWVPKIWYFLLSGSFLSLLSIDRHWKVWGKLHLVISGVFRQFVISDN